MHAVTIAKDVNYSYGSDGTCKFNNSSHAQSNSQETVL